MKTTLIFISIFILAATALSNEQDPLMNISVEDTQTNSKLAYLVQKYKANPSADNKQAVEQELDSMHKFDSIFGGMTQQLGLDMSATAPKIDFDCYKKRMELFQTKCGALSAYGLKYAKNILMTCNQGVSDSSFENTLNNLC